MTQTQPIVDPPPPRAFFVAVVSNAIALILLLLGFRLAGIGFVALALISGIAGLLQGRSGGPRSPLTPSGGSTGTGRPGATA
jgi:hypothetical protein